MTRSQRKHVVSTLKVKELVSLKMKRALGADSVRQVYWEECSCGTLFRFNIYKHHRLFELRGGDDASGKITELTLCLYGRDSFDSVKITPTDYRRAIEQIGVAIERMTRTMLKRELTQYKADGLMFRLMRSPGRIALFDLWVFEPRPDINGHIIGPYRKLVKEVCGKIGIKIKRYDKAEFKELARREGSQRKRVYVPTLELIRWQREGKPTVKLQILCMLLDGEKRYTELRQWIGKPDRTVYVNLVELKKHKLIQKVSWGLYRITEKGTELVNKIAVQKQVSAYIRVFTKDGIAAAFSSRKEIMKLLHAYGFAFDVRKPECVEDLVAMAGIFPKNLQKSFVKLRRVEREYLGFLTDLFTHSLKKYLDIKLDELSPCMLAAIWMVMDSRAWQIADVRPGLMFDFPKTWRHFEPSLSAKLKDTMKEKELHRKHLFEKLRKFSSVASM